MSKNAKRRLKEIQAMERLVGTLRDGVYLGDDFIEARQLVDASWLEPDDMREILEGAYEQTEDDADARATIETAARRAVELQATQLADALDADVLDPNYPVELVEQELREAGLDPERIAATGRRIAARFARKSKIQGGTMRVRAYDVLSNAVENGVERGWRRAHKHTESPPPQAIREHVEREVMNAICEWFEFE